MILYTVKKTCPIGHVFFSYLSMKYQVFYGAAGFSVCVLSLSILPVLERYAVLPFNHRHVFYITYVVLSDLVLCFGATKLP